MFFFGRTENLELLSVYGANQWKLYNDQLEVLKVGLQTQLDEKHSSIDEVNRKRKREQTDALKEITRLEEEWSELCRKNLRIDYASKQIEAKIEVLRERLPSAEHQAATESLD
jgi:peptidoglycan hydrolase CwlO-like protein